MKRRVIGIPALLGCLALGACASDQAANLPGSFGLQQQLVSFYQDRAQENGATCNLPQMSPAKTDVVQDDGKTLILNVTYFWQDTTYGGHGRHGSGASGSCSGQGERRFTVARRDGGGYTVTAMTGAQRN